MFELHARALLTSADAEADSARLTALNDKSSPQTGPSILDPARASMTAKC
jgi:hypothetical protein